MRRLLRLLLQADREELRWHGTLLRLVEGVETDDLLDVGCGDGEQALAVAARLGVPRERVHGIEIHPASAEAARRKIHLDSLDLESARWPHADQSLGLVVMNQVLEHLKNPHFCLAEAERVLKVGGHLAVGVPNLGGLLNRLQLLLGRQPMCLEFPGPHVRAFTHGAFTAFLRANPAFDLVSARGASLYPLPWPFVAIESLPSWSAYAFTLLRKRAHRPSSAWGEALAGIGATPFVRP